MKLKISYKLILVVGCVVITIISIFSYITVNSQRNESIFLIAQSAHQLSETVKSSTKYDMLINQRESVHKIIETIGKQDGIEKVRIFNKEGEIIFSSDKEEMGDMVDKRAEACYACHAADQPLERLSISERTRIFQGKNNIRNLGIINPIYNESSCWQGDCHAHGKNQKVLGVLDITMSLEDVDRQINASHIKMFVFSLSAILAISFILWFFVQRLVGRPVSSLVKATQIVAEGNLNYKINMDIKDELGDLGKSFNEMAYSLKDQTERLQETSEELNKAYQKLKKAYKEVGEKNKAYLEMLGFVTHELKSPLASIVFALASLREGILGKLNKAQKSTLKSAANSADYLNFTIANYLNLSRFEEGELTLKLKTVIINKEIISPAINRISEMASDRKMTIFCDVPSNLQLTCDPDLLNHVFQNLLSNAIKYGKKGGKIDIGFIDETKNGFIQFYIFNEGQGFNKKEAKILFNKFSRFHAESYDTKSGTGLGLFVTKVIIEKHGGEVRAESQPGQWANLIFTISTNLK